MMPANTEELHDWIVSVCTIRTTYPNGCTSEFESLSADYARALAADMGSTLIYGENYSRNAWANYVDSVRAWHRADYEGAQLYRERAERAADRARGLVTS